MFLQILVYGLVVIPEKSIENSFLRKIQSICKTFVIVNIAMAKAWLTFFQGKDFVTWKSSR